MKLNKATIQKIKIALARKSFYDYCNLKIPKVYNNCDYLKEICNEMQDFLTNDLELLIINVPPRHAKTLTKDNYVPWCYGQNKNLKFICVSYNQNLSRKSSKYARNTIMEEKAEESRLVYSDIFPEVKVERGSSSVDMWKIDGAYSENYLASSPGGTLTGIGADMCFPSGTMVKTINGDVAIERLTSKNSNQVLSYNHNCDTIELDNIVATRRLLKNEFITIRTESGSMVRCTTEHRIFIRGKGYIRADEIKQGDVVISICNSEMRPLWKNLHEKTIRVQQNIKKRLQGNLLFKGLFVYSEQRKKVRKKILPGMWEIITQGRVVLFGRMQKSIQPSKNIRKKKAERNSMFGMWKEFLSNKQQVKVLFNGLQKSKPFKEHDGKWKFSICEQRQIQKGISRHKTCYIGKRKSLLRHLWNKRRIQAEKEQNRRICSNYKYENTSQRFKQTKQYNGKFSCFVLHLSCYNTQDERVSSVELSRSEEYVYDIQIEKNNNFFANNILVHNCIIDDIIKNSYEAFHEGIKQDHFDFFTDTLFSRLEGLSKVILVMTRWATDDLAGRLIKMYSEQGRKLKVITKRAELNGTMLNPSILSFERWQLVKQTIGEHIANANYNQEPADLHGRLYGEFQTYTELPKTSLFISALCDPADEGTDYLASVVYTIVNDKAYIIDILYTNRPLEETEPLVIKQIVDNGVDEWIYEKNFGGKSFGKNIQRELDNLNQKCEIVGYTQTQNKKARIYSNSTNVTRQIIMPADWEYRFHDVHEHVTKFSSDGVNEHDDIEDVLTKIVELINN